CVLAELKKLRDAKLGIEPTAPATVRDRASAVAAADVAQSLLTGQFNLKQPTLGEAAAAGEGSAMTATFAGDANLANKDVSPPARLSVGTMAAKLGVPPPRPAGAVTGTGSGTVRSSVIVADHGDKSTMTESGRHYWRSAARLALQVAEALDYAHQQGVLHRDIKPSNLLLDTQGTLWVTDFGLAKASADVDNLTHTGDIVGTLRYMAPERFNGVSDASGDIYSLGLTLYELAVQRPAYEELDRTQLMKQVTQGAPPAPRKLNHAVPRDLETIILKAIEREPSRRYPSAHALAQDLRRFIDDKPILARQASVAERLWRWSRRNPAVAGLSAAMLLLLV